MHYQISGWVKHAEEDVFTDGCQPGTGVSCSGKDTFTGKTPQEAIKAFTAFFGAEEDEAKLNACEEDGRIDVSVMETGDGTVAGKYDIEQWKAGKMRLWDSTYTGTLEKVERVRA
jgi:hypothetical protein